MTGLSYNTTYYSVVRYLGIILATKARDLSCLYSIFPRAGGVDQGKGTANDHVVKNSSITQSRSSMSTAICSKMFQNSFVMV